MSDFETITAMTEAYFRGLHEADVELLRGLFHEDVVLKAPGVRRTRDEWLELVASRAVPADEGYGFDYKILSVEIIGDQAMVKAYCPLLGSHFVDYLGFLREEGEWLIVGKMYAEGLGAAVFAG